MSGYSTRLANEALCTFSIDDEPGALHVTGLRGREALSELFRFRVEFASEEMNLDPASMTGRAATIAITGETATRYVRGILRSFERTGQAGSRAYYAARIAPPCAVVRGERHPRQRMCEVISHESALSANI